MNAIRQPQAAAISGTQIGATMAPMFVPELKIPVAKARSLFGNHSATVLIDAGKFAASPTPSRKRAKPNVQGAVRERGRHPGERPPRDRDPQPELRADPIEDLAPDQHHHGVRHLEGDDDAAVVELATSRSPSGDPAPGCPST